MRDRETEADKRQWETDRQKWMEFYFFVNVCKSNFYGIYWSRKIEKYTVLLSGVHYKEFERSDSTKTFWI
jgi:hypothetical protein